MLKQFIRLYLAIMIPVIVLMICAMYGSDRLILQQSFIKHIRSSQQSRYAWVREQLATLPVEQWRSTIDSARRLYPSGLQLRTVAETLSDVHPEADELQHYADGEVAFAPMPRGMTYAFQRVPGTDLVLGSQLVFSDSTSLESYLYLLLFAAFASAPVLWFWFRPFWRDLQRLSEITDRIGSGDFGASGAAVQTAAVKPFSAAIDRMAERIRELLEAQKRLTSSVAHELTTPITQLVFALEMLKASAPTGHSLDLMHGMEADLRELESLVAELLEYARLEHSAVFEPEKTSLTELIGQAIETAGHIPGHGKSIAMSVPGPAVEPVLCDAHQMHRAILNLLRNALRYAGTRVEVSAERRDDRTWVHVDDDGPGIPAEQSVKLFDPFARLDASRARHTGGHGLGLAIVQQVAKLHGGIARIDRSPLGGARVSIGW